MCFLHNIFMMVVDIGILRFEVIRLLDFSVLRRLVAERQIKLGAYQYEIANQSSKSKCEQYL